PLLFLLYLNDIVEGIDGNISLFADDTSLFSIQNSWNEVETQLKKDLRTMETWAKKWLVDFNAEKTFYISLAKGPDLEFFIKNVKILRVKLHKHLGIYFNENFDWADHVHFICNKASQKLGLQRKYKRDLNRRVLIKLFHSMIRPVLDYGCCIYDNLTLNLINKLENINRRAAIICTGAIPRTETVKLLSDLGWTTLSERRKKFKMLLMYKIFHNLAPGYLIEDLKRLGTESPRFLINTRRSKDCKFKIAKFCRKQKFKKSFFPSAIEAWNSMPLEIRMLDSLAKLKKYLNIKFDFDNRFFDYNNMSCPGARVLTQLRLGLSSLNNQLYNYNITDNPFCQMCLDNIETTEHFLFNCPNFVDARVTYIKKTLVNDSKLCSTF
ncbi:MAG: hypothetical protein WAX04_05435, partial [Oscillospiraceae bacterium]